jgi:hypothetical protein
MKIEYKTDVYVDTTGRKGWGGIGVFVYKKTDDSLLRFDLSDFVTHITAPEPFSQIRHSSSLYFPKSVDEFIEEYYETQYEIDRQTYIDNVKKFVEDDLSHIEKRVNILYELYDYIKIPLTILNDL